jgi:hypothetical protein
MNAEEIEKSLCLMYRKSLNNQKIELDYKDRTHSIRLRIKNLDRQFRPYNMKELCEKYGI